MIEAHDGPIESLAFDRYYLRLGSAGGGYPQVWSLGMPNSALRDISLTSYQTLLISSNEFPLRHPDFILIYVKVFTFPIKVRASSSRI
jgi:hypothetical protein